MGSSTIIERDHGLSAVAIRHPSHLTRGMVGDGADDRDDRQFLISETSQEGGAIGYVRYPIAVAIAWSEVVALIELVPYRSLTGWDLIVEVVVRATVLARVVCDISYGNPDEQRLTGVVDGNDTAAARSQARPIPSRSSLRAPCSSWRGSLRERCSPVGSS